jgi:hypothetical protein
MMKSKVASGINGVLSASCTCEHDKIHANRRTTYWFSAGDGCDDVFASVGYLVEAQKIVRSAEC